MRTHHFLHSKHDRRRKNPTRDEENLREAMSRVFKLILGYEFHVPPLFWFDVVALDGEQLIFADVRERVDKGWRNRRVRQQKQSYCAQHNIPYAEITPATITGMTAQLELFNMRRRLRK